MGFRAMLLASVFAGVAMVSCAKSVPAPSVPPPVPVPVATARAHQADVPSAAELKDRQESGQPDPSDIEKTGRHKLSLDLPKEGHWAEIAKDRLPKAWRAGFASRDTKAAILMDLTVHGPPAVVKASLIRAIMTENGTKCGSITPLADGSGMTFTLDEGGGTVGKMAVRELDEQPGRFVLELFGQWPKAVDAIATKQFDAMVESATMTPE